MRRSEAAATFRDQVRQFSTLQQTSKADPALTGLRLLDVLAGQAGQHGTDGYGAGSTNLA